MPLLPGKKNIGHNIKEMEKNHPHDQAVAASLHEAYDSNKDRHEREKEKYGR